MNTESLLQNLDQLKHPKVLVIGDLILDEYIEGEIERISREAPVPVVIEQIRHYRPGGAANTLYNLAALGSQAIAIGVIGSDDSGLELTQLLVDAGIETQGIVTAQEVPTTTKTRISAQSRQSVMQQVLRLDRLPNQPLKPSSQEHLIQKIDQYLPDVHLIVLSDYGNGVITPGLVEHVRQAAQKYAKPWIVDSQEDLKLFHGASLLTPNKPEAENNLGYRINTEEDLKLAGPKLLKATGAKALLITRGDEGMSLFDGDGSQHDVSALNRADVFDVTGAGDTVVATLAHAFASGCTLKDAMYLANLAASIVIRQHGCATTSPKEMKQTLLDMQKKGQLIA